VTPENLEAKRDDILRHIIYAIKGYLKEKKENNKDKKKAIIYIIKIEERKEVPKREKKAKTDDR